jgi:biopolymer transport protein ExbB/TolQ
VKQLGMIILAVVLSLALFAVLDFRGPRWLAETATGFNGKTGDWTNWVNVHLTIWASFFLGMISIYLNWNGLRKQKIIAQQPLLNREKNIVYEREDRREIFAKAAKLPEDSVVRQMVQRALAQYQISKSWSQANDVLQSTTEELQHRVDLGYTTVRYLSWLIPTLGFIGTVLGIANALAAVGLLTPEDFEGAAFLPEVVGELGIAFSTTLVALMLSGILIFFASFIQADEEKFVTDIFSDCVDNLLNKLHEET